VTAPLPDQTSAAETSRGGQALVIADIVVLSLLSAVLGVLGSFLSPAMPEVVGVPIPVGVLVAVVGNLGLGVLGARGTGSRLAPVFTGLVWLAIAIVLGTQRTEGDLIVTGSGRGVLFLLLGTAAAAIAIGVSPAPARPTPAATSAGTPTPGAPSGR
jgi:hypothetical protein